MIGGAGVGRCLGWQPRAKVSMMIMRPPQHGHGFGSTRGCPDSAVQSVSCGGTRGGHSEQLARPRDVGRAVAIGERSIVTDAIHALGQHMHQEAPDELVS
jgi:hypothetical protein